MNYFLTTIAIYEAAKNASLAPEVIAHYQQKIDDLIELRRESIEDN
jgi:hypothetical protein